MLEKQLLEFHQKLSYESIHSTNIYESELKQSYKDILHNLSVDYGTLRQFFPKFLSSFEANNPHSVAYSIELFFSYFDELVSEKTFASFDLSILNNEYSDATIGKVKAVFEAAFSKKIEHRISEESFDISQLSESDKSEIVSLFVDKLQADAKIMSWDKNMVEDTAMNLVLLHQLLKAMSQTELFYYLAGLFLDRLTTSELFQVGRDLAEEIIITAFKDGMPELGFFNSFRFYSNNKSIHAALLYANLSLSCLFENQKPYSEKYIKEVVWQGMKFFRNVELFPLAIRVYESKPTNLTYNGYDNRSLDHTYFTILILMQKPEIPSILLEYLNKERENILSGGIHDAVPWLLTLYNIKRLFPNADFSPTGFGFYLSVFESIVPADSIKKQKDIIEGSSPDLKKHLKESLIKLNETRNKSDFVYDNNFAIGISNRLIAYSNENSDVAAFLMAMLLKSDFSILFVPKGSTDFAPLILPDIDVANQEVIYENNDLFLETLSLKSTSTLLCIALAESRAYELSLIKGAFNVKLVDSWSFKQFKELSNNDYFTSFTFEDTIKDNGGVREITPEEYKDETQQVIDNLGFSAFDIPEGTGELLIVKDMGLSKFPHNLFIDQNKEFIASKIPVCNVLSIEWLMQSSSAKLLPKDYSKSIWVPTESGDIPLNYLWGNIEGTANEHSFNIFHQAQLEKPLSSDINIVCSHGAKNISETQIIFQNDNPTYNMDAVIGSGRVLIFFVCYSGSMKTEFFRNNITSLVKRFISQGYEAVIAPFWALDVTVPRYWLPEFLKEIDSGSTISNAVFEANKKVHERYPTPAASACLHLYGNPNFRIVKYNE